MAIRIDEYGHIIRDDTPVSTNSTNTTQTPEEDQLYIPDDASSLRYTNGAQTITRVPSISLETSTPWYGGEGVFWTISMAFSLGIALLTSMVLAPMIFETNGGSSDFLESITNFLFSIAPYAVFIGTFVGSIWYNCKGTKSDGKGYHGASEYILSVLCAAGGAVGTGLLLFLLALAVYIIAAIFIIGIVIAIIAGLLSGG